MPSAPPPALSPSPVTPGSPDGSAVVPADAPVLVTGATGQQGGATVRALLAAGTPVRGLVRDPTSPRAQELAGLGVELVTGDLRDAASLTAAVRGVRGVFSIQMPAPTAEGFDFAGEVTQATHLIDAALAAGVPQFVHTSVSGVGQHLDVPGWAEGDWSFMEPAMGAKLAVQEKVRTAGFASWTLLKPCFFMENLLPSAAYLMPRGIDGGLITAIHPGTELAMVAVDDIGRAAAAAFADPERFHQVVLELASDRLTMRQVAEVLAETTGRPLTAPELTPEQALAAGMPPMGMSGLWMNAFTQPAYPEDAEKLGLTPTRLGPWARQRLLTEL